MAQKLGLPPETTKRNDTIDVWIDSGVSHEAVVRQRMGVEQADMRQARASVDCPIQPASGMIATAEQMNSAVG